MTGIIYSILGTLGFLAVLNMPKSKIPAAIIGAAISAVISVLFYESLGTFVSVLIASVSVGIYSEIMARFLKTPSTIILIPSTLPLLPGGTLYYSVNYFIQSNYALSNEYALETIKAGFGIAVGAIITSILKKH